MNRLLALGLVVGSVLLYRPTASFSYVNADDTDLIAGNQSFLRDWSNLPRAFLRSYFETDNQVTDVKSYYRPLVVVSFMADAHWCGDDPGCAHLTNMGLHAIAVVGFYMLLHAIGVSTAVAAGAGLLFAVHPLNAQVVGWIPGRNDSLLAVCTLIALLGGLRFSATRGPGAALVHVAGFALALASKESAVGLPLVLSALVAWRPPPRRVADGAAARVRSILPLALVDAGLILVWWYLRRLALDGSADPTTLTSSVATVGANWSQVPLFFAKAVFPLRLGTMPWADAWDLACGLAVVVGLGAFLWEPSKREEAWPAGGLVATLTWVAVFLMPGLAVPDLPAYEHRSYLPLMGLVMGAAAAVDRRPLTSARVGVPLTLAVALLLAIRTAVFLPIMRDPLSYWTAGTARMPFAPRAHVNVGLLLEDSGELTRAEAQYRRALELDPTTPKANNNIGVVLSKRRAYDEARFYFEREVSLYPQNAEALYNLGLLEKIAGRSDDAIALWERAIAANHAYVPAYEQLVDAHVARGEAEKASSYRERLRALTGPRH